MAWDRQMDGQQLRLMPNHVVRPWGLYARRVYSCHCAKFDLDRCWSPGDKNLIKFGIYLPLEATWCNEIGTTEMHSRRPNFTQICEKGW